MTRGPGLAAVVTLLASVGTATAWGDRAPGKTPGRAQGAFGRVAAQADVASRRPVGRAEGVPERRVPQPEVRDRWEVTMVPPPNYVMQSAEISNPLGAATVVGWDRDHVRVVAVKRAHQAALLRHLKVLAGFCTDGSVCIKTYLRLGSGQRALPISMGRIDLTIEVPRRLPLRAQTFVGDLEAVGMRAGARLESKAGAIRVQDVTGLVVARTLRGNQTVASVRGSVELDGVAGDLDLTRVHGDRVVAKTVEGNIRAHEVRGRVVRLTTTSGEIWVLDLATSPGGRYHLSTFDGGIRLRPVMPAAFDLVARTLQGKVTSRLPLTVRQRTPRILRARAGAGGGLFALTASADITVE